MLALAKEDYLSDHQNYTSQQKIGDSCTGRFGSVTSKSVQFQLVQIHFLTFIIFFTYFLSLY